MLNFSSINFKKFSEENMEDEECLPENSPLKHYLQSLGYSDFQISKKMKLTSFKPKLEFSNTKFSWDNVETLDEEVLNHIRIVISTQMLFEEDISDIEKILSNFKIVKSGMLKSMFRGTFGALVIFFGLFLFYLIGGYAFLIVSSFYAYKAAQYLSGKRFTQVRLKKLAFVLKSNFNLLQNTIRFIQDNNKYENLIKVNNNTCKDVLDQFVEGFEFYNKFKSDFLTSLVEIICILTNSTEKLINKIPFCEYVENPQYYICKYYNKNFFETLDVPKLYQIYLLVQSEFLQRLILSLVPNIRLSPADNLKELNKILIETCVNLLKIKNNLNKKFKFIFINGVHYPKTKINLKLPVKVKLSNKNYTEALASNINETSNFFQNLLIKSRIIEENLKEEKISENLEEELVNMQNDLNTCSKNIEDSFILLKKVCATTEEKEILEKADFQKPVEASQKIPIHYSNPNPEVKDEVFEAYFGNEILSSDSTEIYDWDLEDKMKKKLEKEFSNNVIQELKLKIVRRAKQWEEKERELLNKNKKEVETIKVIEVEKENDFSEKNNDLRKRNLKFKEMCDDRKQVLPEEEFSDLENKILRIKPKINKYEYFNQPLDNTNSQNHFLKDDLIEKTLLLENKNYCNSNIMDESPVSYPCVIDKKFLSDLSLARQKILDLSNNTDEEFSCDSQNSNDEN